MRRTQEFHDKEAHDREIRPFDLFLRLQDSTADWHFGRFSTANMAHKVGIDCLHETRPSHLPHGRKCRNYFVIDSRTDERVERPITQAA